MSPRFGFELQLDKGIPLVSGLGGSAASAVAAVVAANALLDEPRTPPRASEICDAGREGRQRLAARRQHCASLYGGLVLTVGIDQPRVKQIPSRRACAPSSCTRTCFCRPGRRARILKGSVEMTDFVWQTANLAGFISGCYTNDLDMVRESFEDVVIEQQRQALIPGFADVRRDALAAGALGCSISGAGPAVFSWAQADRADDVLSAMRAPFEALAIGTDAWVVDIDSPGARVVA